MVKYTQTIRRLLPANCLSLFHHFIQMVLKGLIEATEPEYSILSDDGRFLMQA